MVIEDIIKMQLENKQIDSFSGQMTHPISSSNHH